MMTSFKKMAGVYRLMYNLAMESEEFGMTWRGYKQRTYSGTYLWGVIRKALKRRSKRFYNFIHAVDKGIISAAIFTASKTYISHFKWDIVPDYMSRKKSALKFKTNGNVRIFYDHIVIPKLGKVKLFEKGFLPQGKKISNTTFSFDGKHWWISFDTEEAEVKNYKSNNFDMYINITKDGTLVVNDCKSYSNILFSKNYKKALKRYQGLLNKSKRQIKQNLEYIGYRKVFRKTKNYRKTQVSLAQSKQRLAHMRKDYFKKIAHDLAITKPTRLHVLSEANLAKLKQSYLSRFYRESNTLELISIVENKLRAIGCRIFRNLSPIHAVS